MSGPLKTSPPASKSLPAAMPSRPKDETSTPRSRMRPASFLPATASALSPELLQPDLKKTKFPAGCASFRRLDATRHPMESQFLCPSLACQHTSNPACPLPDEIWKTNGCYRPQYNPRIKKTLIHPRYLKPEPGISLFHMQSLPIPFVTLSAHFSVFIICLYICLYMLLASAVFQRLIPYVLCSHHRGSCSLILILLLSCFAGIRQKSRTQSFPSVSSPLRRSVSRSESSTPLPRYHLVRVKMLMGFLEIACQENISAPHHRRRRSLCWTFHRIFQMVTTPSSSSSPVRAVNLASSGESSLPAGISSV